ncbi:MAG TPA: NAD(P)/FAD-dependent oxidoreductase [Myxococcaceae bacterium]|nr:NAD(P)/FAD-dependent oxidoreductase [Myxococcaceae bacterium]
MSERHVVIVGGGLAGLSAGCYARAAGFHTTVVEHNIALGGVCTAWPRGPYIVDGCIHWLTGGTFAQLYDELGIVPVVGLRVLKEWTAYRDVRNGRTLHVTQDLDALGRELRALAPEDGAEIGRIVTGARRFAELKQPFDQLHRTFRDQLAEFWQMRDELGTVMHFRKPLALYVREHLHSDTLRRILTQLLPPEAPALFLLMVLGYLERGHLSRPVGGTAAFRDALVASYQQLGGASRLHATVDEILVQGHEARGVRLSDGSFLMADAVISTSSLPETILRLLGGRFGGDEIRARLARWRMFQPVVLASFGVALPLSDLPSLMVLDRVEPFEVGDVVNDSIYLRVGNDDTCFAPAGHTVVQTMLASSYEWWATRGARYTAEKDAVADVALSQLGKQIPGLVPATVRMVDIATPLTFWTSARAWRGAYEGWLPNAESFFGQVRKTLPGLHRFVMAGQWVEPGGGVPTALLSGRQAVQVLCSELDVPFRLPRLAGTQSA